MNLGLIATAYFYAHMWLRWNLFEAKLKQLHEDSQELCENPLQGKCAQYTDEITVYSVYQM